MPTSSKDDKITTNQISSTNDIDVQITFKSRTRDNILLEIDDRLRSNHQNGETDFLTDEAVPPIPRCQALPDHAFSRLTGRSILVALSRGWFFQTHPDPARRNSIVALEFRKKRA